MSGERNWDSVSPGELRVAPEGWRGVTYVCAAVS